MYIFILRSVITKNKCFGWSCSPIVCTLNYKFHHKVQFPKYAQQILFWLQEWFIARNLISSVIERILNINGLNIFAPENTPSSETFDWHWRWYILSMNKVILFLKVDQKKLLLELPIKKWNRIINKAMSSTSY